LRRRCPILGQRPTIARVHKGTKRGSAFTEHHPAPFGKAVDVRDTGAKRTKYVAVGGFFTGQRRRKDAPLFSGSSLQQDATDASVMSSPPKLFSSPVNSKIEKSVRHSYG
jgi:hypothetical protein